MTWNLVFFILFAVLAIVFFFYIEVVEAIINAKGLVHSFKNYRKGITLLIKKQKK